MAPLRALRGLLPLVALHLRAVAAHDEETHVDKSLARDGLTKEQLARLEAIERGAVSKQEVEVVIAQYDEDLTWAKPYRHVSTVYCKGTSQPDGCLPLPNVGREGHTYLHHIVKNYDRLAKWTVFTQGGRPSIGYKGHRMGGGHMLPGRSFNEYVVAPPEKDAFFIVTGAVKLGTLAHSVRAIFSSGDGSGVERPQTCPALDVGDEWEPYFYLGWFKDFLGSKCGVEGDELGQTLQEYWERYVSAEPPASNVVFFSQGARFGVSRERILERPKSHYQELLQLLDMEWDPCTNYFNEWLWHYLVGVQKAPPCVVPPPEDREIRELNGCQVSGAPCNTPAPTYAPSNAPTAASTPSPTARSTPSPTAAPPLTDTQRNAREKAEGSMVFSLGIKAYSTLTAAEKADRDAANATMKDINFANTETISISNSVNVNAVKDVALAKWMTTGVAKRRLSNQTVNLTTVVFVPIKKSVETAVAAASGPSISANDVDCTEIKPVNGEIKAKYTIYMPPSLSPADVTTALNNINNANLADLTNHLKNAMAAEGISATPKVESRSTVKKTTQEPSGGTANGASGVKVPWLVLAAPLLLALVAARS